MKPTGLGKWGQRGAAEFKEISASPFPPPNSESPLRLEVGNSAGVWPFPGLFQVSWLGRPPAETRGQILIWVSGEDKGKPHLTLGPESSPEAMSLATCPGSLPWAGGFCPWWWQVLCARVLGAGQPSSVVKDGPFGFHSPFKLRFSHL